MSNTEQAQKREQTMQPFAPGDIFIACTLLNVPDDDHARP